MSGEHVTLTVRPINVVIPETPERPRAADELTLAHHAAALQSRASLTDEQRAAAAAAIGRLLADDYPEGAPSKQRRNVWVAVAFLAARDYLGEGNASSWVASRCRALGVNVKAQSVETYGRKLRCEARSVLARFFWHNRRRVARRDLASALREGAFSAIRQLAEFERRTERR